MEDLHLTDSTDSNQKVAGPAFSPDVAQAAPLIVPAVLNVAPPAQAATDVTTKDYIINKFVTKQAIIRVQLNGRVSMKQNTLDHLQEPPAYKVYSSVGGGNSVVLVTKPLQVSVETPDKWKEDSLVGDFVIKVKNYPDTQELLREFKITTEVHNTVLQKEDLDVALLPSQVGIIEEYINGEWVATNYVGMITIAQMPLLHFVNLHAENPDLIICIMVKAAFALEAIHNCHFEHLDLKPHNMIVSRNTGVLEEAEMYQPKFIDFGEAQQVPEGSFNERAGGTPGYISITNIAVTIKTFFQARGSEFRERWCRIDQIKILQEFLTVAQQGHSPPDDRYSLGATFYEALMMCKNKILEESQPTQLMDWKVQQAVADCFQQKDIVSWTTMKGNLLAVARAYRKVWEAKEWKEELRRDFSGFEKTFPTLEYLLQPSYHSELFSPTSSLILRNLQYENLHITILKNLLDPSSSSYPVRALSRKDATIHQPRDGDGRRFVQKAVEYKNPSNVLSMDESPVLSPEGSRTPASGKTGRPGAPSSKPYDRPASTPSKSNAKSVTPSLYQGSDGVATWDHVDPLQTEWTNEGNRWVRMEGKDPVLEVFIKAEDAAQTKAVGRPWRHGISSKCANKYICAFFGCKDVTQAGYFVCTRIDSMKKHWASTCCATHGAVPEYTEIKEKKP